jgi:anaerobic selenocysteine-containing dehydrogenase
MNPEDMAEAGIAEEAEVEIASAHGTIRTLARSEDRLRRGVISMTHMFGPLIGSGDPRADGGANVGQLTSLCEDLQPINFMPRFSGIPVNVRLSSQPDTVPPEPVEGLFRAKRELSPPQPRWRSV